MGPDPPSLCNAISGNLVANCGFETGNFTGWTQGTNTSFQAVVNFSTGLINTGDHAASFGSVDPTAPNTLTQYLSTTVGGTYTLTYYLANDSSPSDQFEVLWNGVLIPGSVITDADPFAYTQYMFSGLTATGTSTALEFEGYQVPGWFYLDDVSVVTPEPSSLLLMASGLFGLGSLLRRRFGRA